MQSRSIRRSGQPTRATASRMRVIDRDLIRGGHYGQRSCEPRKQAEHMAATDPGCYVKILLANSEPSTHGNKADMAIVLNDVPFQGCGHDANDRSVARIFRN